MFLQKYLNDFYYELVLSTYDESYLNTLDEKNFLKIYHLLEKYKFYYIDDIILKYLEIFELNYKELEEQLKILKNSLGENFVYIIGNDLRYLDLLLEPAYEDY